ncbi:molybdopterin molybdotransferase MoeA [Leptospira sp. 201903070]|uniref:Molybdopterin molybdenumtransferase n=1 Tax=Leptospira ainlahdjerensis TaxID=2810033 RepID=A0ABS2UB29_9LEPT|nr:molybdopterin molybdotransferase MoeA [Leptospira ainlahdjerensis]MBM9577575.1 molybdopterin molybdotransferase MoeA [Leptospira ainlahdjerensis]
MISIEEALSKILSEISVTNRELVPLEESLGRILADNVYADRDYPPFHRSTMDGYAIKSADYDSSKIYHCKKEIFAGMESNLDPGEEIVKIMTGAPVPEGLDAVIKIEDSQELSLENSVSKVKLNSDKIFYFMNIAVRGEDLKKGEFVLGSGTKIGMPEISLLASLGVDNVSVNSLPTVSIVSTGNEVVPVGSTPLPFQIRDSNSYSLIAILNRYNIKPKSIVLVPDEEIKITEALDKGLESDILLLSGGVSMGSMDLIPPILERLGVKKIFHKVSLKPGKPIWFGKKGKTVVFGLPGNPFSVQVCARIFLDPYIRSCLGMQISEPLRYVFYGKRKKKSSLPEFFPAFLETKDKTGLSSKSFNGSGDIRAGLFADGIALHPGEQAEILEGNVLNFFPW